MATNGSDNMHGMIPVQEELDCQVTAPFMDPERHGGFNGIPCEQPYRSGVEHDEEEESSLETKTLTPSTSNYPEQETSLHGKKFEEEFSYFNSQKSGFVEQDGAPDNKIATVYEMLRSKSGFPSSFSDISSHNLHIHTTRNSTSERFDCPDCSILHSCNPSDESQQFWLSIPEEGRESNRCHVKKWNSFKDKMKEWYPQETSINSTQTMSLLTSLLGVASTNLLASVHYEKFIHLVKFFGPLRRTDPVLMRQLYHLVRKSQISHRTSEGTIEKISWFAGDMSRDEAESLLKEKEARTFLVRMSQTKREEASFVISVKSADVVKHFEIEQDYDIAAKSNPFSACMTLSDQQFDCLVDIVESLLTTPLYDDNDETEVWCEYICPGLPLNGVITGYKRSRRR